MFGLMEGCRLRIRPRAFLTRISKETKTLSRMAIGLPIVGLRSTLPTKRKVETKGEDLCCLNNVLDIYEIDSC